MRTLPIRHAGSPIFTNAHLNRTIAERAHKAGMSAQEIANEWPEVWRIDKDGRIGQKYEYELGDGSGRYETNRLITEESLKAALLARGLKYSKRSK